MGAAIPGDQGAIRLSRRGAKPRFTYRKTHRGSGEIRWATVLSTRSWDTVSKNARMSRSITQSLRQYRCRRFDLWLQIHPRHRPSNPVSHGRSGWFVLRLLRS
jgi:hypothetical protein